MAKTIASGVGMTNDWLASQDVLSLKTLWAELAHLRKTAYCEPACGGGVRRVPGNGHPYLFLCKPDLWSRIANVVDKLVAKRCCAFSPCSAG
jgi:hypothetical protein